MSLSLHSSMECGGSMSRGSRDSRDMGSEKSFIGLISVGISSRPDRVPGSTDARHSSSPISHLNEEVCRARRSGTSRGSAIRAKEMRRGARVESAGRLDDVVRDAAKGGPSRCCTELSTRGDRLESHARTPDDPPDCTEGGGRSGQREVEGQRKRAAYLKARLLSRRPPG